MKITKKELPLVFHGVVVVALFCLLLVSVAILMNNSVAWFSHNKEVTAGGASVTLKELGVDATYYVVDAKGTRTDIVQETDWRHIFQDLGPGDTVTIGATYSSADQANHTLKVYFKALEEVPLTKTVKNESGVDQTRYYYLGSQLKVVDANKVISDTQKETTVVGEFLVTPSDNQIYHTTQATPNEIALTPTAFQITSESPCTWEFTVEFVNLPTVDQNDYQGFGKDTTKEEKCWWQLIAVVED